MERRKFLQTLGAGSLYFAGRRLPGIKPRFSDEGSRVPLKNWVWTHPSPEISIDEWKRKFEQVRRAGIQALIIESYSGEKAFYESRTVPIEGKIIEQLLPVAKEAGLEVHAWICALICNAEPVIENHPEWFVISRNGESTLEKPPYVESYKWLCPSRLEVQEFLQKIVSELALYENIKGIHLDYIRYPDVILPEALQPKYNLVQDREYPQFDFCYCPVCRKKFEEKEGIDPLRIKDPALHEAWRNYRYETVTNLVSSLAQKARLKNKFISAAVFATPELARKYVRQDWPKWNLDAFMPMIYHNYYNKSLDWLEPATREGVEALPKNIPLYSGLFIPQISPAELPRAVQLALRGGARGISLFAFSSMQDEHWKSLAEELKKAELVS